MTTREELEEFAVINNLFLHPDRDVDYFVSLLNSAGGQCPCDRNRICPCQYAAAEAQRAIAEDRHKEACCTCHFFVTQEYITAWNMKIDTTPEPTPTAKTINTKWEIQTPKLKSLLNVFQTATKLATKGEIDKAADLLTETADETDCDMCQKLLSTERIRMDLLGSTCETDKDECEIEKQHMKDRAKRIENFLKQVDEYAVTGKIEGKEITNEQEAAPPNQVEPPEKKSNPYHTCLKTMPANMPNAGALPEYETRVRFAIASKMCAKENRGQPTDFQKELEAYKYEHPEFFERTE